MGSWSYFFSTSPASSNAFSYDPSPPLPLVPGSPTSLFHGLLEDPRGFGYGAGGGCFFRWHSIAGMLHMISRGQERGRDWRSLEGGDMRTPRTFAFVLCIMPYRNPAEPLGPLGASRGWQHVRQFPCSYLFFSSPLRRWCRIT